MFKIEKRIDSKEELLEFYGHEDWYLSDSRSLRTFYNGEYSIVMIRNVHDNSLTVVYKTLLDSFYVDYHDGLYDCDYGKFLFDNIDTFKEMLNDELL